MEADSSDASSTETPGRGKNATPAVRAKEEYDKCVEFIKYSGTVQFGQVSVFLAVMTGCVLFFFGEEPPNECLRSFGKLGIVVVATCLWITHESHSHLAAHFLRRAAKLEKKLRHKSFSALPGMPEYRFRPSKWALGTMYALFTAFWFVAFLVDVLG